MYSVCHSCQRSLPDRSGGTCRECLDKQRTSPAHYRELLEHAAYAIIAGIDNARQAAMHLQALTGSNPLTRETREALIALNVQLSLDVFPDTPEDEELDERGRGIDGDADAEF